MTVLRGATSNIVDVLAYANVLGNANWFDGRLFRSGTRASKYSSAWARFRTRATMPAMVGVPGAGGRQSRGSGRCVAVAGWLGLCVALMLPGCGARTSLLAADSQDPDAGLKPTSCTLGESEACGSDVG